MRLHAKGAWLAAAVSGAMALVAGPDGFGANAVAGALAASATEAAVAASRAADRPPPGVPLEDVARRENPESALRPLGEVLDLLGRIPAERGPSIAALDPATPEAEEVRRRAERGVEALAQGKALMAVTDLEAAVAIDPGNPELLRHLAQAYSQLGNEQRAIDAYERMLILRPHDPQALLATGVAAAARRSDEEAVRRIAAALEASERGPVEQRLPLPSAVLGWRSLAGVLREMEFDAAAIEALTSGLASLEALESSFMVDASHERPEASTLRAEMLLARADARTRLSRNAEALEDLQAIATLPGADPDIVLARELLVLERDGRSSDAERRLARSLEAGGHAPSPRLVELAEWLVARHADRPVLMQSTRSIASAHPNDPVTARLTAAVEPQRGADAFASVLAANPRSAEAWRGYLRAASGGNADRLAAALVDRLRAAPASGAQAIVAALGAGADEGELRRALSALPESPERDAALARLALLGRDHAGAWSRLATARERWPGDIGLALAQLETAAALEESSLIDALERGVAGTAAGLPGDPEVALAAAVARRAAGDGAGARARLEAVIDAAPASPAVLAPARAALAGLLAEEAAVLPADAPHRRGLAERAASLAQAALDADSENADAALVLLRLLDPRQGALADPSAWTKLRDRLRAGPLAWLNERVVAEEEIARGRLDSAIERLRRLAESRPNDGDLVGLFVSLMVRSGRAAAAIEWLEEQLERSPGLVSLRDARLSALAAAGRTDELLQELSATVARDPGDALAQYHHEVILRALGRQDEAAARSRERLRARPSGPRRSLELANIESRAGRPAEALAALDDILELDSLTAAQRLAAVEIALRIPSSMPGRNDTLGELAMRGLDALEGTAHAAEMVPLAAALAIAVTDEVRDGSRAEREEALDLVRSSAARAADASARSGNELALALRWRDGAQLLLEADLPDAAAEFLRAPLERDDAVSHPWPPPARRLLQSAAFACDAAAGGRADQAITLLRDLRDRGLAPFHWTRDGAETLDAALMALSSLFTIVGDKQGSERILEVLLAEFPDHAMAMNNLAWSRLERGALDARTIELAERAVERAPNEPAILDTLGWVRYHQGMMDDAPDGATPGALSLLRRSVELGAKDPSVEVLDHYGDALWRHGDRDAAQEAWREVVRQVQERFDRGRMMPQLASYLLSETGVRIIDPDGFYDAHFGAPAQRAARKLQEASRGTEPSIAPSMRGASRAAAP